MPLHLSNETGTRTADRLVLWVTYGSLALCDTFSLPDSAVALQNDMVP